MKLVTPPRIIHLFEERIERGIEFLDDYFETKDWVHEIDIKGLDLNDATQCVCGQLFDPQGNKLFEGQSEESSGYDYAVKFVVEHGPDDNQNEMWARTTEYGFNIVEAGRDDTEEDLDDEIYRYNGLDRDAMTIEEFDEIENPPNAWELLNDMWIERLEKRKAEMGAMA